MLAKISFSTYMVYLFCITVLWLLALCLRFIIRRLIRSIRLYFDLNLPPPKPSLIKVIRRYPEAIYGYLVNGACWLHQYVLIGLIASQKNTGMYLLFLFIAAQIIMFYSSLFLALYYLMTDDSWIGAVTFVIFIAVMAFYVWMVWNVEEPIPGQFTVEPDKEYEVVKQLKKL